MSSSRSKITAIGLSEAQSPAGGEGSFGFGSVLALPSSLSNDRQSAELTASSVADQKDIARTINLNPSVKLVDVKKEKSSFIKSVKKKSLRRDPAKYFTRDRNDESEDTLTEKHSDSSDSRMSINSVASSVLGKRPSARRISSDTDNELAKTKLSSASTDAPNRSQRKKRMATKSSRISLSTKEELRDSDETGAEDKRRGRPPSTGDYVAIAATKQRVREEREKEIQLTIEREIVDEWVQRARERRPILAEMALCETNPPSGKGDHGKETVNEANAVQLVHTVEKELAAIEKIATTSKNLKGTYTKLLKDAASTIKLATSVLSQRSLQEETKRMAIENLRLEKEVESLKLELNAARNELPEMETGALSGSSQSVSGMETRKVNCTSLRPLPNSVEKEETAFKGSNGNAQDLHAVFEGFARTIMIQVGTMISARFEALENRLLPEQPIRPPLAASRTDNQSGEVQHMPEIDIGFSSKMTRKKAHNIKPAPSPASLKAEKVKEKPTITENTVLNQRVVVVRQQDSTQALSDSGKRTAAWTTVVKSKKEEKKKKGKKEEEMTDQLEEAKKKKNKRSRSKTELAEKEQTRETREQQMRTSRKSKEVPEKSVNYNYKPRRRRAPRTAAVAIRGKDPQ